MNNKNLNNEVLNNICNLLKLNNLQQKDLCEALNLTNKSFTEWKAGRSVSYMKRLPEIADYFGVTVNYLLGKETNNTTEQDRKPIIFCSSERGNELSELLKQYFDKKENAPGEMILTESEKMILELFRQLPPDKQELVAQTVKAFANSQK